MSFGDPNNPYGQQQPQQGQPGYGYPQQAPQGVPAQGNYGYPQQGQQPYGGAPGYPNQAAVQQQYAGWGSRFVARIIDGLIVGILPVILMVTSIDSSTGEIGGLYYVGILLAIGGSLFLSYLLGTTGQTPGRKAVSIQVLKESTGRPLGFGMAFVRGLLDFINALPCYVGYLWPAFDAKKQHFADKIVGSVVVKKF
ncbi:RDD family protein [Streptomyces bambusae]|uniref:RDD family protein n=1 Tax=Streptomyces bambusae TaxID=1550616 RepID=UPI001D001062|nr:RDD family protein [Streptomyces bambusae]MCB5169990.1 RDD family protein [Streptomyces bambusae]